MDYLLRRSFHNRLGQSVNKQSCVLDYHSHSPFAAMELFDYLSSMCEAFLELGERKKHLCPPPKIDDTLTLFQRFTSRYYVIAYEMNKVIDSAEEKGEMKCRERVDSEW